MVFVHFLLARRLPYFKEVAKLRLEIVAEGETCDVLP